MNSIGDPFHWLIDQLFEMACNISVHRRQWCILFLKRFSRGTIAVYSIFFLLFTVCVYVCHMFSFSLPESHPLEKEHPSSLVSFVILKRKRTKRKKRKKETFLPVGIEFDTQCESSTTFFFLHFLTTTLVLDTWQPFFPLSACSSLYSSIYDVIRFRRMTLSEETSVPSFLFYIW